MIDKQTDAEVRDIVENEGIGYAVLHYMGAANIKSKKTARLWQAAEDALTALADHLRIDA